MNTSFQILKNYFTNKPVKKVQVFGSFARTEEKPSSDIDILITMQHPVGLIQLASYKLDLENMLKRKVDLATIAGISKEFYNIIEKDIITVYEKN